MVETQHKIVLLLEKKRREEYEIQMCDVDLDLLVSAKLLLKRRKWYKKGG